VITASEIEVRFGATAVLSGVGLAAHPGQVIGLIGPNGSGKSTLLRCLFGVLRPVRGTVLYGLDDITSMNRRQIARAVSFGGQHASADAVDVTVAEYVLLGRHVHRRDHQSFTEDDHRLAHEAMVRVEVGHLAERLIGELSGGERQRVMVARCVAQHSPTLLLDEPTNHLDVRYQHDILQLVRSLGLATIIVLHDLNLANAYCDQLVLLDQGRVVCWGDPDDVLHPDTLEPVYGIPIRRIADGDGVCLAFGPPPPPRARATKSD
jgi:iron complex transport system ATP-binding protein